MPTDKVLDKQVAEGGYITNFIVNTDRKGVDKLTLEILIQRLTLLDGYWSTIQPRHLELEMRKEELKDEDYFTSSRFLDIEDDYISARAVLVKRIETLRPGHSPTTSAPPTQMASHLPKLPLPRFSGTQTDWESFKAKFSSMVKDVPTVSNVLKLQHLLSCVEGEAARRLTNLEVISENFTVAWDTLLKRYDNPRVRLSAHMNRVLSMPAAKSKSAGELNRLMDGVAEAIRAMQLMERPVDQWDDWFVELTVSRLDPATREDWEKSLEGSADFPTYKQLSTFLENRARSLETAHPTSSTPPKHNKAQNNKVQKSVLAYHTTSDGPKAQWTGCSQCNGQHHIAYCPTFTALSPEKKRAVTEGARLCLNCLRRGHDAARCRSRGRCRAPECKGLHHTLLHSGPVYKDSKQQSGAESAAPTNVGTYTTQIGGTPCLPTAGLTRPRLLATAVVILESDTGLRIEERALIDPASEGCFVTEQVVQALSLHKRRIRVQVNGVGGDPKTTSKFFTTLTLRSKRVSGFELKLASLILGKLTSQLPSRECKRGSWNHLDDLELADPRCLLPGDVDFILGADAYPAIIMDGLRKGRQEEPIAQKTVFGWALTGLTSEFRAECPPSLSCNFSTADLSVAQALQRFWELEEVSTPNPLSHAEQDCEDHFTSTHSRDKSGRYTVRLPFAREPVLPSSLRIATTRFFQLERRLQSKPAQRQAYVNFMSEIESLGHMEVVPTAPANEQHVYYMPHHGVFKGDNLNPKVRVVFNASQSTSSGLSLNDCLHTGRKLQTHITAVLTRWRFFKIVFSADIVKMFRQFRMHDEDTDWLRILWRASPDEALRSYRMLTVVYGTACAPFQAIRVLQQLAIDERLRFPKGAAALENHMYVDDALVGADTAEEARELQKQLIEILASAGMSLDKWSANDPSLLPALSTTSMSPHLFRDTETPAVSTLGLQWIPTYDAFCFKVTLAPETTIVTKRSMLSEVARLFDPLGWLSPVTVAAKLLIQQLWIRGSDWDQPVDKETFDTWKKLRGELPDVETLRLPRWLGTTSVSTWYLHGFADASQRAYSAAVYVATRSIDGIVHSTLLAAKTKVAPVKTVSIPRLELCGALLLARLVANLKSQLLLKPAGTFCWSDSQVVLAWLSDHPSRWNTFVSNRVSEILTALPDGRWQHVKSSENPADLASRGTLPSQLLQEPLWWRGPAFINSHWESWNVPATACQTELEQKRACLTFATKHEIQERPFEQFISKFSSLTKLIRVLSYVLRWKSNARLSNEDRVGHGPTAEELSQARHVLIRGVQQEYYAAEKKCLIGRETLPHHNPLRRFMPFVDSHGILRIGGRLQNAFLRPDEKHPAIVPNDSHIAELLIRDAHLRTLHGGPQLIMSYLLRAYWIVRARNRIRRLTHQCVQCTRFSGRLEVQQMAPLPPVRVTPARPFAETGLDYAGPYLLRPSPGRGIKAYKGYLAIFVCMVTRAVHIEVVSDYSTQTFLLAFRRFISRRGLCNTVYTDNGTTFQGAEAEIQRLFNAFSTFGKEIPDAVATDGVRWKFIPPRAPHFGGLWEAGVKAAKHHLRRVMGEAKLTHEEFSTLAAQVEACLNSRPLSPLSSDPADVSALTPGHFLIGSSLTALPEPYDPSDLNVSGLPRYKLTSQMRNHFWGRWQREVLQHLQQRAKWLEPTNTIQEGDLVLIRDELHPPTKWPLARVTQCHPGPDGLIRVLSLKTATTSLQRPLVKVIRLPVDPPNARPAVTTKTQNE